MRLIKKLCNSRSVTFDSGKFDEWCVYVVEANGSKKAPFDVDYFTDLQNLATTYPKHQVYDDFVKIFDKTDKSINYYVLQLIDQLVPKYNTPHQVLIEQWFTVLYAGMIAEENKANAILKKRVKRLGMYQILVLNLPPSIAANYSKGKPWRELDAIMKEYGF